MRTKASVLALALLLVSSAAPAGMDNLEADDARRQIAASEGVVFVDLFAEW